MSLMRVTEIIECLKDLGIPILKVAGDTIAIKGTDIRINLYLDDFPGGPWKIERLCKDPGPERWTSSGVHNLFELQDWFINEFEKHK